MTDLVPDTPPSPPSATPALGCWLDLPSAQVADIVAGAGFDFIVLDLEHGPAGTETLHSQLMAIGTRAQRITRVPEGTEGWIKRVLDAGSDGVMVPRVETAAQAATLVQYAFYAPKGARGDARSVVRAADWGRDAEGYKARWNADGFLSVQIESLKGLENAASIAAVQGVSELFFGPADFSADAGVAIDSATTLDAAKRVAELAAARRLHAGSVAFPGGDAATLAGLGFDRIAPGSDVAALVGALDATLQSARAGLEGGGHGQT